MIKGKRVVMTKPLDIPTAPNRMEKILELLNEAIATPNPEYPIIGSWEAVWLEGEENLILELFADQENCVKYYILRQMEGLGLAERLT